MSTDVQRSAFNVQRSAFNAERLEPVVITCAADSAFAAPLAVMVRSVLATADPRRPIDLFVLDAGLTADDKRRLLASWASDRLHVAWITLETSRLGGLPLWGRMPAATYARLLIGDLLPASCRRTLWLDSDAVLTRDVGDLWAADTGTGVICAVQDLVVPYADSSLGIQHHEAIGVDPEMPYFNAGVMLIDLEAWRARHVAERALEYLRTHWRHVTLWDQEGLNVALRGAWRPLDPRWNVIASVSGRRFFTPEHLEPHAYQEAVSDPWIVHFAGTWKPWLLSAANAYRRLYFSRLAETAWAGTRPARRWLGPLMRVYDSSLRDHTYGLERWWLRWVHLASRSRAA